MENKKIESKIVSWKIKSNDLVDNRPEEIRYTAAPKRPSELPCDIKKVKVKGESWTVFVGLLNGKPYEIFGGLAKFVDIPNKYKEGKLVKGKKIAGLSSYNLVCGDEDDTMTIKDVANVFENTNHGSFTRTISLSLRHGVELQYIVDQLGKDKDSDFTSFSKVMARVLKVYIKDGTVSTEKVCPSCGSGKALVYQEGCLSCRECEFSKCS